jgi:hypothetical protein
MTGWKTKTGAILTAVGGVLTTSADGCPVPDWSPWLKWIGGVTAGLGVALMGYGIGDKVERYSPGAAAMSKESIRRMLEADGFTVKDKDE